MIAISSCKKIGKMIEDKSVFDVVREKKDPLKSNTEDNLIECKRKPNINIIASNFEKYLSLKLGKHLQFVDSFQFMIQSLDNLSSNLPNDRFIYTERERERQMVTYHY